MTTKATEKQVRFILDLIKQYYSLCADRASELTAIVSATDKLSKQDASKAIAIMKQEADLRKRSWDMYHRGLCKASNYYAAHTDIWDDTDENTLNAIWAKL